MSPTLQRQIIRTVGAALVTAMVAELLRRTAGPPAVVVISPIVMIVAHQLLDGMASQIVDTVVGVTA